MMGHSLLPLLININRGDIMGFPKNVVFKIGVFLAVGAAFVGILLVYGQVREERPGLGFEESWVDSEAFAGDLNGGKRIEKTFAVKPGGELVLDTDVGDVVVEGWATEEVNVSVDVRGDSEDLRKFDVEFVESNNRIEVRGLWKRRGWRFWHWDGIDVRFSIRVPQEFSVKVSTAGGDIRLRTITGRVVLETSGGDVRVQDVEGKTTVETSGGDIVVQQIIGNLKAETSGGDVTVRGTRGDTRAETSGGDINIVAVEGGIQAETSGGDIQVRVEGENRGIQLDTSGGDIVIYVRRDIRATVDASTSGGEVECDLEVVTRGKIEESELHGKINGGGERIVAESSGGDIYIRALD